MQSKATTYNQDPVANSHRSHVIFVEFKLRGSEMDRHFVTYPKVNVCSSDFQPLTPGRWLNDRIMEVSAQWLLKERIAVRIRDQVHSFSPFHYGKIAQTTARRGTARYWRRSVTDV
uniref:Ubiquitin-like protease family profile domain-containing protein n=1 Tax=Glossina palpalis gambiensis TaxID=67801 RepID=A0A1B0BTH0_9MUSC